MSILYFFRHGLAAPKDNKAFPDDSERPLIKEGEKRTRASAEGLVALHIDFDRLLTSPFRRAKETAAILAEVLHLEVEDLQELAASRAVADLIGALRKIDGRRVILVGHQPLMGECISFLLTNSTLMNVNLKKSGVCAIELHEPVGSETGVLKWMMSPKQLAKLR